MPFKSERQRRWMWANKPKMARRWSEEAKKQNKERSMNSHTDPVAKKAIKRARRGR